jgi:hypothetical protein
MLQACERIHKYTNGSLFKEEQINNLLKVHHHSDESWAHICNMTQLFNQLNQYLLAFLY